MSANTSLKPVTIGLAWHSMNSDNLGVGALTVSNIAILRDAAKAAGVEPKFVVIGWKDKRAHYDQIADVDVQTVRTRELASPGGKVARLIKGCDIVFDISAGDSFADIYGAKRFNTGFATKARTVLAGKPLVLSPQTIGPFESWWSRKLATWVMNKARFVCPRDAKSTQFAKDIGVTTQLLEATDVAMRLPYTPPAPKNDGKTRVGINVSGLLFNGGYTKDNQFDLKASYADVIRQLIEWFQAQDGVEVHLIGHVQSEHNQVEDDQRVGAILAKEYPGTVLAPVFTSPSLAKDYIAGMDFFTGARMHATIAAFSSGVPVVPMAYSRKFEGVFGTLGYNYGVDCKKDDGETIVKGVADGFTNRAKLKADLDEAMKNVNGRLDAYTDLCAAELAKL